MKTLKMNTQIWFNDVKESKKIIAWNIYITYYVLLDLNVVKKNIQYLYKLLIKTYKSIAVSATLPE